MQYSRTVLLARVCSEVARELERAAAENLLERRRSVNQVAGIVVRVVRERRRRQREGDRDGDCHTKRLHCVLLVSTIRSNGIPALSATRRTASAVPSNSQSTTSSSGMS